ncbi:MAG: hypothetical protein J7642_22965 [Cyanobacteria bacterium SBC]|nr:hypothetical protein [Cyanobacteria bacterium SBC]
MSFRSVPPEALLSEIDRLLQELDSLQLDSAAETTHLTRQTLSRVRDYLQAEAVSEVSQPERVPVESHVEQSISQLHASLTHLDTELDTLKSRRDRLAEEVQQLERDRSFQLQAPQQREISDVAMQALRDELRLQLREMLSQEMEQIVRSIEARRLESSEELPLLPDNAETVSPLLHPEQRLQRLQQLQLESDRMLLTLDSTLRVVFEALLSNLQSYQDSLSHSVEKMYNLSQQGEAIVSSFVRQLAQRLERELTLGSIAQDSLPAATEPEDFETTVDAESIAEVEEDLESVALEPEVEEDLESAKFEPEAESTPLVALEEEVPTAVAIPLDADLALNFDEPSNQPDIPDITEEPSVVEPSIVEMSATEELSDRATDEDETTIARTPPAPLVEERSESEPPSSESTREGASFWMAADPWEEEDLPEPMTLEPEDTVEAVEEKRVETPVEEGNTVRSTLESPSSEGASEGASLWVETDLWTEEDLPEPMTLEPEDTAEAVEEKRVETPVEEGNTVRSTSESPSSEGASEGASLWVETDLWTEEDLPEPMTLEPESTIEDEDDFQDIPNETFKTLEQNEFEGIEKQKLESLDALKNIETQDFEDDFDVEADIEHFLHHANSEEQSQPEAADLLESQPSIDPSQLDKEFTTPPHIATDALETLDSDEIDLDLESDIDVFLHDRDRSHPEVEEPKRHDSAEKIEDLSSDSDIEALDVRDRSTEERSSFLDSESESREFGLSPLEIDAETADRAEERTEIENASHPQQQDESESVSEQSEALQPIDRENIEEKIEVATTVQPETSSESLDLSSTINDSNDRVETREHHFQIDRHPKASENTLELEEEFSPSSIPQGNDDLALALNESVSPMSSSPVPDPESLIPTQQSTEDASSQLLESLQSEAASSEALAESEESIEWFEIDDQPLSWSEDEAAAALEQELDRSVQQSMAQSKLESQTLDRQIEGFYASLGISESDTGAPTDDDDGAEEDDESSRFKASSRGDPSPPTRQRDPERSPEAAAVAPPLNRSAAETVDDNLSEVVTRELEKTDAEIEAELAAFAASMVDVSEGEVSDVEATEEATEAVALDRETPSDEPVAEEVSEATPVVIPEASSLEPPELETAEPVAEDLDLTAVEDRSKIDEPVAEDLDLSAFEEGAEIDEPVAEDLELGEDRSKIDEPVAEDLDLSAFEEGAEIDEPVAEDLELGEDRSKTDEPETDEFLKVSDDEVAAAALAAFMLPEESEDREFFPSPETDTITALTELVGGALSDDTPDISEESEIDRSAIAVEPTDSIEDYQRLLAPDEDVLLPEERSEIVDSKLELDTETRRQLEADLQDLELAESAIAWAVDADETITPVAEESQERDSSATGALQEERLSSPELADELEEAFDELAEAFFDEDDEDDEVFVNPFASSIDLLETSPPLPPPPPPPPRRPSVPPPIWLENANHRNWYLGIDWGATGFSATLFDRNTGSLYPLAWEREGDLVPRFSLPAVAVRTSDTNPETGEVSWLVGFEAARESFDTAEIRLEDFKPCLDISLPRTGEDETSQPVVQWSERVALPLADLRSALQQLLEQVKDAQPYELSGQTRAESIPDLAVLLPQLGGIILNNGFPFDVRAEWDTSVTPPFAGHTAYQFNVREAVLRAGLIARPDRVFFLDDSIAATLSMLPHPETGQPWDEMQTVDWSAGETVLTVAAGASAISLILMRLSRVGDSITPELLGSTSWPYGGTAIDSDIVASLLLEDHPELRDRLDVSELVRLPTPGVPDLESRIAFQQWIDASPSRRTLLDLARHVKTALSSRDRVEIEFAGHRYRLDRQTLERKVLNCAVEGLNRTLNRLLSETGVSVEGIDRAIGLGGTMRLDALSDWLRQKLPNAVLLDRSRPGTIASAVACGLALLPLYPSLLEEDRQHYGDLFLLNELLQVFSDSPAGSSLPFEEILKQLERRGIHSSWAAGRIVRFLDGELPSGLLPTPPLDRWLVDASRNHSFYQQLRSTPLFEREADDTYRANPQQSRLLKQYLQQVTAETRQTLREPLSASLG